MYSMERPKLGHAVIVNNVARDFPGSYKDVDAMEAAFKEMELDMDDPYIGCSQKVRWPMYTQFVRQKRGP